MFGWCADLSEYRRRPHAIPSAKARRTPSTLRTTQAATEYHPRTTPAATEYHPRTVPAATDAS
jgi:hypothetical protein